MLGIFTKALDLNKRELSRLEKIVTKVSAEEARVKKLKDKDFPAETAKLKKQIANGKPLSDVLPEAFALVREAAVRKIGQRPFDVQIMAGIALFEGNIAEQKTGEGKTLTATLPLYLHALTGKGVHLVTVNDYLARLGAGWNAPIFNFSMFENLVIENYLKIGN